MSYLKEEMEYGRWLREGKLQDKLFFKTDKKNIIFIFRHGEARPAAVMKCGKCSEMEKEYLTQKRALALFPAWVPKIYFFETDDGTGNLCMEYVKDNHLSNIVSSVWIGKRKKYLYELEQIFLFCIAFLKHIPVREGRVGHAYSAAEIEAMASDLLGYFGEGGEIPEFKERMDGLHETPSPLIMQHRDFCVRNILYADRQRKVIIDWEDSKEDDLPMVDFNMLLISMVAVYRDIFHEADDHFFGDKDLMEIVRKMREEVRQYLGVKKELFENISALSTLSLCSQNIRKGRFKTAEEIFTYLVRELNQRGILWA